LPENIIQNFTGRNAIVFDCFGGTGTMGWKEKSEIEHSGNVNFNTYMEPKPDGH
jgi:hypothetical protein